MEIFEKMAKFLQKSFSLKEIENLNVRGLGGGGSVGLYYNLQD